jgi:hypothetical protein
VAINEPGHTHDLTFSCFRRLRLLAGSRAKRVFLFPPLRGYPVTPWGRCRVCTIGSKNLWVRS